jgi:nucleotide-binding universal stress UspA family protein
MAIKSILAAFNGTPSSRSALALAVALAAEREAHVTGVLAHGVARARSSMAPWLTSELDHMLGQQEAAARADIAGQFWAAAGGERAGFAFLDVTGDPTSVVSDVARTYDIVVMGRFEQEAGAEHFAPSPDVVALQSGRPVLIVPPGHHDLAGASRAVLAWDGKRASARALADAVHVLPAGAHVTVVSVGDEEDEADYRREHRDPVIQLRRHGFEAEFLMIPPRRRAIGEALLSTCAEVGASLLVMGAYEHSKFSEDLIGGVTARVLREAPLPVLMAH